MTRANRVPLGQKPLAFVDIETTGFSLIHHEIIEIAIIRTDSLVPFQWKIRPSRPQTFTASAMHTTGYNEEEWKDARPWHEVAPEIHPCLQRCALIGHYIHKFDEPFLRKALERVGLQGLGKPIIDTMDLAFALLVPLGLESLSLDACCRFLRLPGEGVHRALGGAERCKGVYELCVGLARGSSPVLGRIGDRI